MSARSRNHRLWTITAVLLAACGPKPSPAPIPVLPGDGDANVAKPSAPVAPPAPDPWSGRTDLIVPPAPRAPAAVELPAIQEITLANGLRVFVVKSDRLPVVSMQLAIRAGRMHEPRARLGIAETTANMLVKGTKKRDALALARAVDFVGGTIRADATYEATLVSCSVMARNAKTCFDLIPEMISQPSFPDSELDKVKDERIASVRGRLDDAAALAGAHVQNLLWGNDHVRGWIDSEASIASIKRDDVVAWHKQRFVPSGSILVITGDVDAKKLRGELDRSFGRWAKGTAAPAPTYKEPGLSGSRIRIVDKPGQTQTQIRIAQLGIKHDDPRFFDSLVWNYALGAGMFSSRLMKVVRVEGGKTYGASSTFDRNLDRGSFVATTFTRNAEAVATAKLVLAEIEKMATQGPTKEEVDAAIAYTAGSYGLRFQSASDVGSALIGAELHGFGKEYLSNYPLAVAKVDVESAKRAAAEVLTPRAYVLVMVGDAKDLEPQLKAAGWRYEKVSFTDTITPDVKLPEAPPDAKAVEAARKLVDEALAAKGGKAKLAALKGFRIAAAGETAVGPQSVPVETERLLVLPDKMRIDATLMQKMKLVIVVDGKTGWQLAPDPKTGQPRIVDMGARELETIEFERWREPELILMKAADPKAAIRPGADESIEGKPHGVVRLAAPSGTVEVRIYIDRKSKLVTRMVYDDGATTETDEFSDYKDVAGIKVAHTRKSKGTGPNARATKLTVKTVEIDPKIDPALFKKPAAP